MLHEHLALKIDEISELSICGRAIPGGAPVADRPWHRTKGSDIILHARLCGHLDSPRIRIASATITLRDWKSDRESNRARFTELHQAVEIVFQRLSLKGMPGA